MPDLWHLQTCALVWKQMLAKAGHSCQADQADIVLTLIAWLGVDSAWVTLGAALGCCCVPAQYLSAQLADEVPAPKQ